MHKWNKTFLSDVADVALSNVDKKTKANERPIRLCNYTDVHRNPHINQYVSRSFMWASCNKNEYEKFLLKKGQVAITKDSEKANDIGVPTYVKENFTDVVLGYHLALITPNHKKLDGSFLNYWLNTSQAKTYFENHASGSGQRYTLVLDSINSTPLYLPPLSTQQAIAKVLSDLDSKIELNNKINQQLEEMAKTIYDYWFVQFDFPNDEGKPYKSSGGKMVYNKELKREIPEGWEVKRLSEIANITMGQSPSGHSYNESGDGVVFFQGSTDFGWRFPQTRQFTTEPSRMAKEGDILLSVRAPVGTLNIADQSCCIGRGLSAINSKGGYNSYLYYVMEYFKQVFDNRNNTGTTFGSITKDDLFSLRVSYPNELLLAKYDNITSDLNSQILINYKQNQSLSSLRDWLLPMLMNGQITVKEAEDTINNIAAEPEIKGW